MVHSLIFSLITALAYCISLFVSTRKWLRVWQNKPVLSREMPVVPVNYQMILALVLFTLNSQLLHCLLVYTGTQTISCFGNSQENVPACAALVKQQFSGPRLTFLLWLLKACFLSSFLLIWQYNNIASCKQECIKWEHYLSASIRWV